jgi:hypothetical protein
MDISSRLAFLSNVVFYFKARPQIASNLQQGIQANILIRYTKQIGNGENCRNMYVDSYVLLINVKQIKNKQEYICL